MGVFGISSIGSVSYGLIKELKSLLVFIHADLKDFHSLGNFRMGSFKVFYLFINIFHTIKIYEIGTSLSSLILFNSVFKMGA